MTPRKPRPRPDFSCVGCGVDTDHAHEYSYMVTDEVWKASLRRARYRSEHASTYDLMCIRCLEARLGRRLVRADFNWKLPIVFDQSPRSARLKDRMAT